MLLFRLVDYFYPKRYDWNDEAKDKLMIIIRCVIVVSMKEDSDAWIIASSGAVDQKEWV